MFNPASFHTCLSQTHLHFNPGRVQPGVGHERFTLYTLQPGADFCNPCAHAHTQITNPACAMHRKRAVAVHVRPNGRLRFSVYVTSTWLLQVLFRSNRSFFCCFTCICEDAEVAKTNPGNTGICSRQGGRYVCPTKAAPGLFTCTCTSTCKPTRVHSSAVD